VSLGRKNPNITGQQMRDQPPVCLHAELTSLCHRADELCKVITSVQLTGGVISQHFSLVNLK